MKDLRRGGKRRLQPLGKIAGIRACTCIIVVVLASQGVAATPSCDPQADKVALAEQARLSKDYQGAKRLTSQVLLLHPGDFRARYTNALTLIDESGVNGQSGTASGINNRKFADGTKQLLDLADSLNFKVACAQSNGWYGIYNTIGFSYLVIRDFRNAEKYLKVAYSYWTTLDEPTQLHLLDNLVQLYHETGNFAQESVYNAQRAKLSGTSGAVVAAEAKTQIANAKALIEIHYAEAGSSDAMLGLQAALQESGYIAVAPQLVSFGQLLARAHQGEEVLYAYGDASQQAKAIRLASIVNSYFGKTCPGHAIVLPSTSPSGVANLQVWTTSPCRPLKK